MPHRAHHPILTAVIAVALAATVPATASSQPTSASARTANTPHERLAREIYAELIGINTVDSVGSSTRAARAMARRFIAAGFPAQDVRVVLHPADSTKGNLIVRYRGPADSKVRPILLLAHIDVVAALRSDWPRDPFTLHEENGFFYGRGTADDKAMAAIFVANLLRYKAEGWKSNRDLILALTAAEESGVDNGVELLLKDHRALIDAEYAINEGGGGVLAVAGNSVRPLYQAVQAAEKVYEDFTLTVRNSGGHSSVPRPDNAIYTLVNGLARLARFSFPVELNPVSRAMLERSASVERPELAAAMRVIAANPADSGAAAILSKEPRYNSLLRTTCVATRLAGGHAYNALPQTATANVNCRIAPTSSAAVTLATLRRVLADTSISISFLTQTRELFPESTKPVDPKVLEAVTAITREMWGDIPVIPTMSTGATDGRFLRAAGIPTYGTSGLFSVPGETNSHGRDEKLRTRSFYEGLAFLDALVRRMGSPARVAEAQPKNDLHWTYSGHGGPAEWGTLSPAFASCSAGREQSPINIPAGAPLSVRSPRFSYAPSGLHIVNNGHTVQANYDAGSAVELGGIRYDLLQFHLHSPSEHTVSGQHRAAELHLVHRNANGNLAVVGVFLREGAANAAYEGVIRNLPRAAGDSISKHDVKIDANLLLPAERSHWSYTGSLTTPPCSEGVSWLVMKTPVELSRAQIAALTSLLHDNARPVQPLGARTISGKQ